MRLQTIVVGAPAALHQEAEQRQRPRHQVAMRATVRLVGANSETLHGEIRNINKGGTQVWLDQPVRSATLVAIDYNDNRLLGEVVYCAQEQAGWLVGIRIEHALFGLTHLTAIGGSY
jgi:hypothetical protein